MGPKEGVVLLAVCKKNWLIAALLDIPCRSWRSRGEEPRIIDPNTNTVRKKS